MSFYEWALTVQAHHRSQIQEDQRALLLLNAWVEGEITLNDLYGTRPKTNGQMNDRLKEYVMEKKGIKKDLTNNRL